MSPETKLRLRAHTNLVAMYKRKRELMQPFYDSSVASCPLCKLYKDNSCKKCTYNLHRRSKLQYACVSDFDLTFMLDKIDNAEQVRHLLSAKIKFHSLIIECIVEYGKAPTNKELKKYEKAILNQIFTKEQIEQMRPPFI